MSGPNKNNIKACMKLVLYDNFGLKGNLDVLPPHIQVMFVSSGTRIPMTDKYVLQTKEKKILKDPNI